MDIIIIETHYLPNIAYFKSINQATNLKIEKFENFQKQSFRNRTQILTANKIETLTVPVIKANSKQIIKDIQIDYSQNWQNVHLRGIKSAYGNSPFFEHYFPYIEQIVSKRHKYLFELNYLLIEKCVKFLKINVDISLTEAYLATYNEDILDCRNLISPKKPLKLNLFTENISFSTYGQVFGEVFVENLSIIDLLMNEGSASKQYL